MGHISKCVAPAVLVAGIAVLVVGAVNPAAAQSVVRGTVVAEDGSPLPNARVEIEGGAEQTLSGGDGTFVLQQLQEGRRVLWVSLLGYRPESVPIVVDEESEAETIRVVMVSRPIELRSVTAIGTRTDLEEVSRSWA